MTERRLADPRFSFLLFSPLLALYVLVMLAAPGFLAGEVADEPAYLGFAERLTHGGYAIEGSPRAVDYVWHGPGLPLVLAPGVAAGLPTTILRLVGPLALYGAVVLLHRTLRRYAPEPLPVLGALVLGLYAPLWTLLAYLHSEPVAILGFTVAMWGTARYVAGGRAWALGVAGAGLALATLTRVEYGPLVTLVLLGLVVWALLRRRRTAPRRLAAVFALGLVLTVPWLAYTQHVSGHVFYWGNSGGLSLYWMTSPNPDDLGDWHSVNAARRDPDLRFHHAFFRRLVRERPLRQDETLRRVALRRLRDDPARYARNLAANAGRLTINWPYSFYATRASLVFYGAFSLGLIALLLAALALARGRPGPPVPELRAFGALAAGSVLLHLAVSGEPRQLMTILPVVVWAIVVALRRREDLVARLRAVPAARLSRRPVSASTTG